jgi:hypothetical protein
MNNKRPKLSAKTKAKMSFFAKVMKVLVGAEKDGVKVNRNKIYMSHGIGIGSPIFFPKRTKFKGYMRS